jgi:hypothetical protein
MKTITNLNIDSLHVRTIEELRDAKDASTKSLSIKIDEEQHKKLRILSFSLGVTMTEIIRAFVMQLIEQFDPSSVIEVSPSSSDEDVL